MVSDRVPAGTSNISGEQIYFQLQNVDWVSGACISLHQTKDGQNATPEENSRAIVKNGTQESPNCR